MTTYVVFKNKSVIDKRFITSFGVSAKETKSPIGFFGTGLKYAIAVLKREAQELVIHAGLETMFFEEREEQLRGKDFMFIDMQVENYDGVGVGRLELPFTTEFAKRWEIWQAYRELYCNCRDEGGEVFVTDDPPAPESGHTIICVAGDKFFEAHECREQIILEGPPVWQNEDVAIHSLNPSPHMFYRGIRALKLERATLATWSVKSACDLTEDRTIKYSWEMKRPIVKAVLTSANMPRETREGLLTAPNGFFEHSLDFTDGDIKPCEEFLDVVDKLCEKQFTKVNHSAVRVLTKHRRDPISADRAVTLDQLEQETFDRAKLFVMETLSATKLMEYPIYICDMEESLHGLAKDGKIFINRLTLRKGVKHVAIVLYEEYLHCHEGFSDFDRQFQTFLLEQLATLGERLRGRIL